MATPLTPAVRGPIRIASFLLAAAGAVFLVYALITEGFGLTALVAAVLTALGVAAAATRIPPPSGRWK
ncbi:MAG: hypothetical protein AAFQ42_11465 [Pseudomonadota bacterium]